jgi:hypothetical protein
VCARDPPAALLALLRVDPWGKNAVPESRWKLVRAQAAGMLQKNIGLKFGAARRCECVAGERLQR